MQRIRHTRQASLGADLLKAKRSSQPSRSVASDPAVVLQRRMGNEVASLLLRQAITSSKPSRESNRTAGSKRVARQPGADKSRNKEPQKPPKEPARRDVVLLGEGWRGGRELSSVLGRGGQVIAVSSLQQAIQALGALKDPIGTLYFVTHATDTGSLSFGKDEGYLEADQIAAKLQGAVPADKQPRTVDFRGCSVGNSPKAMESIRTALGAQGVVAGNCFAVIALSTPIKMGPKGQEVEIVRSVQVTKGKRERFEELYRGTAQKMKAKGCLVTKSEADFFAAGGRFVALWFNPTLSGEWIEGVSVCYQDAGRRVVDPSKSEAAAPGCSLVQVVEPAAKAESEPK